MSLIRLKGIKVDTSVKAQFEDGYKIKLENDELQKQSENI